MLLPDNILFVVIDANIMIGLCANEPDKHAKIILALETYKKAGCVFYAPNVIVMEFLYVLCNKHKAGILTEQQHADAIAQFLKTMQTVLLPLGGDITLAKRAEEIREQRGCSHSADGLYLALAEELSKQGATELLTFDEGQAKQTAAIVPQITVNLLVP